MAQTTPRGSTPPKPPLSGSKLGGVVPEELGAEFNEVIHRRRLKRKRGKLNEVERERRLKEVAEALLDRDQLAPEELSAKLNEMRNALELDQERDNVRSMNDAFEAVNRYAPAVTLLILVGTLIWALATWRAEFDAV